MDKTTKLQNLRKQVKELYSSEIFSKEQLYKILEAELMIESVLKEIKQEKKK